MPAVHRLLARRNNAVAAATVTASSVRPAVQSLFRQPTVRSGNGQVRLEGDYTGADDAQFEMEILAASTGAERLSAPVFTGAGNGSMELAGVTPGTAAQTVTLSLADLGAASAPATLALHANVVLRAKVSGAAGNALTLTVTPNLTLGEPLGATAIALSQGSTESADSRLDFGAVALTADGSVSATAPRLAFNGDLSRVYRHFKRWDGARWQYGFTPALNADIPVGSPVQPVTGTYTVGVSAGATVETYPSLITIYDLLRALAASALVAVDGVVANDLAPGGQAAIDLPLRTAAWVSGVTASAKMKSLSATCSPTAVTDQITVAYESGGVNAELWRVNSAALGPLGTAKTGTPFTGIVSFTVPAQAAAAPAALAPVSLLSTRFAARAEGELPPVLTVKRGTLGVNATPKTVTLTYAARPDVQCRSADYEPAGAVIPSLLGLEEVANLDVNLKSRLQSLYGYRETFVARNSSLRAAPSPVRPMWRATATKAANPNRSATLATLAQLDAWKAFHEGDGWTVTVAALAVSYFARTPVAWAATTAVPFGKTIAVTIPKNGLSATLMAQSAGTTDVFEPSWASEPGNLRTSGSITDGSVVWRYFGIGASVTWAASTAYNAGDYASVIHHVTGISHVYKVLTAGTSGADTDPFYSWPPDATVVDGTVTWAPITALGSATWIPSATVAANTCYAVAGQYYVSGSGGTSGSAEPLWGSADTVTDGTITWSRATDYNALAARVSSQDLAFVDGILSILGQCLTSVYLDPSARAAWDALWAATQNELQILFDIGGAADQVLYDAAFLERYRAHCDKILIDMGVSPGKFEAGSQGSAVWLDPGDPFWWEFQDEDYLPLFTNQVYHACTRSAAGEAVATQEFAFAVVCACSERLKPGDTLRVRIGAAPAVGGYASGDQWTIAITGATPLAFSGGRAGTDTLTWAVQSSTAGALPDYALTASEPQYNGGGLALGIHRGPIPFALGDRFAFDVETGGRFRWRKDANAWSAATAIPALGVSAALADGLTAHFTPGPAPGFVTGDVHRFIARQPASPRHVQQSDGSIWQWAGASATLTAAFASDQGLTAVGLLRHDLSASATAEITLHAAGGAILKTVPLAVMPGPVVVFFAPVSGVRSVTVTLTGAETMSLGWLYAGTPFIPAHNATTCTIRRVYALERGGGVNPRGAYLGGGRGGELAWTDFLIQADLDALLDIIDDCKQDGDAPIVVVPNVMKPDEAALVRISSDDIEISDRLEFQPNAANRRLLSLTLPLTAVVS